MEQQSEYDKKFAEMQRFVPFLEQMIKRLEGTQAGASNPRASQLTKIKSLRDLLLDRTKKMKMENLLKCEQVMINLYSKVGEADKSKAAGTKIEKAETKSTNLFGEHNDGLRIVRERLKNIVAEGKAPTMPVAVSEKSVDKQKSSVKQFAIIEKKNEPMQSDVRVPLYERRPRRSTSFSDRSMSPQTKASRKYTRVLCSPETEKLRSPSRSHRSPHKSPHKVYDSQGKPLFQRRSPKRLKSSSKSPRGKSHKKSHKKNRTSPDFHSSERKFNDVNITLNVPEESLDSLRTENILSRLVDCDDEDVNITELREMRSQLVNELKKIGANTDISDYILKSYKKKKKKKSLPQEIEEGELSDSDSEKVNKIYENLTVNVGLSNKDKVSPGDETIDIETNINRSIREEERCNDSPKIKLSLIVADSDRLKEIQEKLTTQLNLSPKPTTTFLTDIASSEGKNPEPQTVQNSDKKEIGGKVPFFYGELQINDNPDNMAKLMSGKPEEKGMIEDRSTTSLIMCNKNYAEQKHISSMTALKNVASSIDAVSRPKDFYKSKTQTDLSDLLYKDLSPEKYLDNQERTDESVPESDDIKKKNESDIRKSVTESKEDSIRKVSIDNKKSENKVEVSTQIEILKALQKDILASEPPQDVNTNALHQPKLTKVTDKSQLEVDKKKRISLENYKKKNVTQKGPLIRQAERDKAKLLSRALTQREFERFGPVLDTLDKDATSDEDEVLDNPQKSDGDMGPKSPENDSFSDSSPESPIVIPSEPTECESKEQTFPKGTKADVDMRSKASISQADFQNKICSTILPNSPQEPWIQASSNIGGFQNNYNTICCVTGASPHSENVSSMSPINQTVIQGSTSSRLPIMSPSMTPMLGPMTQSRPLMTPSYTPVFGEEIPNRRHVYAPSNSTDIRPSSWDVPASPLTRDDGSNTSSWDVINSSMRENTPMWDNHGGKSPMVAESRNDFGYCTPRHDPFNSRVEDYSRSNNQTNAHTFRQRRDPRLCVDRREDTISRDPRMLGIRHAIRNSTEFQLDPRRTGGQGRNSGRFFRPASSHTIDDSIQDTNLRVSEEFNRMPSTGRNFGENFRSVITERSMSRDVPEATMEIPLNREPILHREPSCSREFRREQSLVREMRRETSAYDFRREPTMEHEIPRQLRQQNMEYDFRCNSTIVGDFKHDRNLKRDVSSRPDVSPLSSLRQDFRRELSMGREFGRDIRLGSEFRRDPRIECDFTREQISKPFLRREPNFDSDFNRERDMRSEQSLGRKFERASSMNREVSRKSVPRDFRRAQSVGRDTRREPTMGRDNNDKLEKKSVKTNFDHDFTRERNSDPRRAHSIGPGVNRDPRRVYSSRQGQQCDTVNVVRNNTPNDKSKATSISRNIGTNPGQKSPKCDVGSSIKTFTSKSDNSSANLEVYKQKNKAHNEVRASNSRDPRRRRDEIKKQDVKTTKLECKSMNNSHSNKSTCEKTEKKGINMNKKERKSKYINESKPSNDSKELSKGIVYTTANIVKGKIMGPGYGVKNYKIPKIKRESDNKTDKSCETNLNELKSAKKHKDTSGHLRPASKIKESIIKNKEKKESDITDSDCISTDDGNTQKKNRHRKSNKMTILSDDEGEEISNETIINMSALSPALSNDSTEFDDLLSKIKHSQVEAQSDTDDSVENYLEHFNSATVDRNSRSNTLETEYSKHTNIDVSKESLDSLNASTTNEANKNKLDEYSTNPEPTLIESKEQDSLMTSINESREHDSKESNKHDVSDRSTSIDFVISKNSIKDIVVGDMEMSEKTSSDAQSSNESLQTPNLEVKKSDVCRNLDDATLSCTERNVITSPKLDHIVINQALNYSENQKQTTSIDIEKELLKKSEIKTLLKSVKGVELIEHPNSEKDKRENVINVTETTSMPDSTEHTAKITTEDALPDSTNNSENVTETNSVVSSSHDVSRDDEKCSETETKTAPDLDAIKSLSSILSVLQDKNKLKYVLNLLTDDSSESEKLKRKLSKLSEIASDDENSESTNQQENVGLDESLSKESATAETADHTKTDQVPLRRKKYLLKQRLLHKDTKAPIHRRTLFKRKVLSPKQRRAFILNQVMLAERRRKILSMRNKILQEQSNSGAEEILPSVKTIPQVTESPKEIPKSAEEKDAYEFVDEISNTNIGKVTKRNISSKFKRKRNAINSKKKEVDKVTTRSLSEKKSHQTKIKERKGELQILQEDIRDMFISKGVLNATGIRMCRLAKFAMVDKSDSEGDETPSKDKNKKRAAETSKNSNKNIVPTLRQDPTPMVVLDKTEIDVKINKIRKKPGPKPKPKTQSKSAVDDEVRKLETESKQCHPKNTDSLSRVVDSDDESLSSMVTTASKERRIEHKTKHKKRCTWKRGYLSLNKKKKKKDSPASKVSPVSDTTAILSKPKKVDESCFTDKNYCFTKNKFKHLCRLCGFKGEHIVRHFKENHPHSEIPLSRINPNAAVEGMKQSLVTDFDDFKRTMKNKQICRFCFYNIDGISRCKTYETLFWHIVTKHTGEYKVPCSECLDLKECPASQDIPNVPSEDNEHLLGYICGVCHYTQVSLENLKSHVVLRHNDEETEVYTISLCAVKLSKIIQNEPQKIITDLPRKTSERKTRLSDADCNKSVEDSQKEQLDIAPLESPRIPEAGEITPEEIEHDRSVSLTMKLDANEGLNAQAECSKSNVHLIFEGDDEDCSDILESRNEAMKSEKEDVKAAEGDSYNEGNIEESHIDNDSSDNIEVIYENVAFVDSLCRRRIIKQEPIEIKTERQDEIEYNTNPHFMITAGRDGTKGGNYYICCVPGCASSFRTQLLIALKRHVQAKHKECREMWDGYCCLCKRLIPKISNCDSRNYSDCLNHFLLNHLDEFPELDESGTTNFSVAGESSIATVSENEESAEQIEEAQPKRYLSVKPMSDLISTTEVRKDAEPLPRIESVVSLQSPSQNLQTAIPIKTNAENAKVILSEKISVVCDKMLTPSKLALLFKCAGRYCSYATRNSANFARHMNEHAKLTIRNENDFLRCVYCEWSGENGADLSTHVLNEHGHCGYSCAHCFYLATSVVLVDSHRARDHSGATCVPLKMATVTGADEENLTAGMLSRREAVLFYTCSLSDVSESVSCEFRSYTALKYREHLEDKHLKGGEGDVRCSKCSLRYSNASSLVAHLKWHGLCLFQCTYCLYGSDTENELLEHASTHHPARRPQAYLRHIIESIENNEKKYKALPLLKLGQQPQQISQEAPTLDMEECPKLEAERAHDWEKLIIQQETSNAPAEITPVATIIITSGTVEGNTYVTGIGMEIQNHMPQEEPTTIAAHEPATLIKIETNELSQRKSTHDNQSRNSHEYVICLDSDDDEAKPIIPPVDTSKRKDSTSQNQVSTLGEVIDLSDDDTVRSDTEVRFGPEKLFNCQKCGITCKNDYYYRTHIIKCYPNESDRPKCPHCAVVVPNRKHIRIHLIQFHGPLKTYRCSVCSLQDTLSKKIVTHMKTEHGYLFVNTVLESPRTDKVVMRYVVRPEEGFSVENQIIKPTELETPTAQKPKPGPKRKKPNPKPSLRFGPEDMLRIPHNPIFEDNIHCARCNFFTKVRINLVRHLQMHANEVSAPAAAPVNPVPHLESNEMHFDRMTNLAASSNSVRPSATSNTVIVTTNSLPPEFVAKYPKYVPEKDRYVCGARSCDYMSLDEGMLRCHWETLHSDLKNANAYRCVHCPPNQQQDTSKPLTALRIVGHLKMHDTRLYGCKDCGYYHYQENMVARHSIEKHGANALGTITIRHPLDASTSTPLAPVAPTNAPTMDLKAWHCGVCRFNSMLRPEVVDHCARLHGYRFQFKCRFCPFRGSVQTAVAKHQSERHPGVAAADVVHIYYKERSLQSDEEGNPLWKKQQSLFNTFENIKTEAVSTEQPSTSTLLNKAAKSPPSVNLAIVKQEADDVPAHTVTLENKYGELCEPKGESYLCPLCKTYDQESKEEFVTHLHEELKYRRWGCSVCSYKSFSKSHIVRHSKEHKLGEVNKNKLEDIQEMPNDSDIEMWIEKLLTYQDKIIDDNKKSRKALEETAEKATSQKSAGEDSTDEVTEKLIETYGIFGKAKGNSFVCPKCGYETPEDTKMYEHLEMELGKNRWACSRCPEKFQLYHEAQQHCSSGKHEQFAHVTSASKDPAERAMWIEGVLRSQRVAFSAADDRISISDPGSLLVVRYEEEATATEPGTVSSKPKCRKRKRKSLAEDNSDDESTLVIAEKNAKTKADRERQCPHCEFRTVHPSSLHAHILRHHNLRPYNCYYCDFNGYKANVDRHFEIEHPNLKVKKTVVPIPDTPPAVLKVEKSWPWSKNRVSLTDRSSNKMISATKPTVPAAEELSHVCLLCEAELSAQGCESHHSSTHGGLKKEIVARGDLIRRCDICMALRSDAESLQEHHNEAHGNSSSAKATYTIIKAGAGRDVYCCDYCDRLFPKMCDLKCHHEGSRALLQLSYTKKQASRHSRADASSSQACANKRKREHSSGASSGVAKKSTTKLPFVSRTVAKKSTTRLPHTDAVIDSSSDEYDSDIELSHYGCRPTPVKEYAHIRTSMPIFNTTMPTTVEKFSAVINLTPSLVIEDINKKRKAPV